jgi:hypothetical protein
MKKRNSYLRKTYLVEYQALKNAIHRCYNEKHIAYKNYGARGITVADEWRTATGFAMFLDTLGPRPSSQHSLDRIDNDRGYEPGNVWWAPDRSTQQLNRRPNETDCSDLGWGIGLTKPTGTGRGKTGKKSPLIPHDGRIQTLVDWARELDMNPATIRQRFQRGLSPADALSPSTSRQGLKRQIARNALLLPTIH